MIGYMTLGTTDLARAAGFYDPIATEMGCGRVMADDHLILWGARGRGAMLGVITPYDKQAPSVGNGVMAALAARDKAQVDKVQALALSLGGTDEGAPGMRTDNFYGAYFRDLDGHKLAVFCMV